MSATFAIVRSNRSHRSGELHNARVLNFSTNERRSALRAWGNSLTLARSTAILGPRVHDCAPFSPFIVRIVENEGDINGRERIRKLDTQVSSIFLIRFARIFHFSKCNAQLPPATCGENVDVKEACRVVKSYWNR